MTPTTAPPVGPPPSSARQSTTNGTTRNPALPLPRTAAVDRATPVPAETTVQFRVTEQLAPEPPRRADDQLAHVPADPAQSGAWALVKAAQDGDMEAFGELFDQYYDTVFRYVVFRVGDRMQAEDITSEAFVRALRRIGSVSYMGRDIGAWFITIARNLIFDHVKSSRYRLEQSTDNMVELSPSTHGPEQQVLDGATNEELLLCVAKLNRDQQECIHLRFLQGLSVAETAAIMERNEGAVKALQHRAVRRLAQLLPTDLR